MKQIQLLSGGAAQGLVAQLRERFAQRQGCEVQGTFGAVGLMKDTLLAGAPCDLLVLTDALIRQLAGEGQVQADSAPPLGVVKTGVAVREGEPVPEVDTPEALKAALQAARGIYFPDPVKATAGIHFMKVLKTLGLDAELADRLHTFPNGAAAMAGLARAQGPGMLGCTQVTEILFAPGVALAGLLPPQFELATVYTAALATRALNPSDAAAFMALMASDEAAPLRAAGGFRA